MVPYFGVVNISVVTRKIGRDFIGKYWKKNANKVLLHVENDGSRDWRASLLLFNCSCPIFATSIFVIEIPIREWNRRPPVPEHRINVD